MKNKVSGNGKSTTFVVPFRWYVIERFSRCIAVLSLYTKLGNAPLYRGCIYQLEFTLARSFLGETTGLGITAITTIIMVS